MDAEAIRDVFRSLGPIQIRRMFGGQGIYRGEAMFALVVGCASEGAGSDASGSSAGAGETAAGGDGDRHDWRDTTYTLTCDGLAPGSFQATLANGLARVPAAGTQGYAYFEVRYEARASGDVDGDRLPDTVVILRCSPQPSNGFVQEAQVFAADRRLLAVLPSPTTLPEAATLAPLYDPDQLSVVGGDIFTGMKVYGPADSHASGPSEHATVRWRWDGQAFMRVW